MFFSIEGLTQLEFFTWTIDHKTFGKTRHLLQNFKQSQPIWSYNCKTLVNKCYKVVTAHDWTGSVLYYYIGFNSPPHRSQPSTLCYLSVLLLISRCPYVAMRGSPVGGPRQGSVNTPLRCPSPIYLLEVLMRGLGRGLSKQLVRFARHHQYTVSSRSHQRVDYFM